MRLNRELEQNLRQYEQNLREIEISTTFPKPEQVLKVLLTRDRIKTIVNSGQEIPSNLLLELVNLDQHLQQQKAKIIQTKDYLNWRNSFEPPVSAWWWYFEIPTQGWWDNLGWLWNGLTLVFLAISVSLIVDAVPRFLSGGLDSLSVFAVIVPSLLALLTSGALTPIGKEAQTYCFQNFNQSFRAFLSMFLAFLIAVIFIIVNQYYFDDFAVYFNNKGLDFYRKGQLYQALSNYQKAVAFNPNYGEYYYNLGLVYEDLQQFDKAIPEYLLAVQQDQSYFNLIRLNAYNNWGRILLIKKDYQAAIAPLLEGKNLLDQEKAKTNEELQSVHYTLFKNLGWAQLELKNYDEAKSLLKEAIKLDANKAPAYCLLAQVLEATKQEQEALKIWAECIAYIDIKSPDEYLWLSIARSKIK